MQPARPLERLLRRERRITAAALAILCLAAWAYVASGAGLFAQSMAGMAGTADVEGAAPRSLARPLLVVLMWWSMMVAMMAPAAAPMVLLYARVDQQASAAPAPGQALGGTAWFVIGYLGVWLGFSILAAFLQQGLVRLAWLSPDMMSAQNRWFAAGVLLLAGLYQLSPAQNVCLRHCRSPAAFLTRHYRPGAVGALRLGVVHGAWCLGCCGLLMGLLFVGGVMNLVWIVALTLLVLAEKTLPGGRWIGRGAGVVLAAWGLLLVTPLGG